MNLNENINRIKEMMGILSENYPKTIYFTGNINWFGVNQKARESVIDSIESEIKDDIPNKFYSPIYETFPTTSSDFFLSLLNDIKTGVLSEKTTNLFISHVLSTMNKLTEDQMLKAEIKKIPSSKISMLKSPLLRSVINSYINMFLNKLGSFYFVNGLLNQVNSQSNSKGVDKTIVSNSDKVLKQLGSIVSKNDTLKKGISSAIYSFISKL